MEKTNTYESILSDSDKEKMLSVIPKYLLDELASKYGISKYKPINELRNELAKCAILDEIIELYEKFKDAGNTTIYLYKFNNVDFSSIQQSLNNLVRNFKSTKRNVLTHEPQLTFLEEQNNKYKLRFESKGETKYLIDAKTRKLISIDPLISSVVLIYNKTHIIEIRTRSKRYANVIHNKLNDLGINCEKIVFNENDLDKIIKWADTLRNATIKPLSGTISSLRITAASNRDLRNENSYHKITDIIGSSIRTGIYIQYNHTLSNNKMLKVGFQINSRDGKIFFKSYVSEEVIEYVLSEIAKLKEV